MSSTGQVVSMVGPSEVDQIVTAVTAGAAAGVSSTASSAVRDAYAALKRLLLARLARHSPTGEVVLAEHEKDPETYDKPLRRHLTDSGADADAEIVAAARELLSRADPGGVMLGRHNTAISHSHTFIVGDHGSLTVGSDDAQRGPASGAGEQPR